MAATSDAREVFRSSPFPLYGLPTLKPLSALYGATDGVLYVAKLGHGVKEAPQEPWVEVIVVRPLHGVDSRGWQWEADYAPLALFHVVVSNDPKIEGDRIPDAETRLAEDWSSAQVIVDGRPQTFQFVRQGQHWGAIRHLEPDHAIVICASNIEPNAVELVEIDDVEPYLAGL